jgi:hypothetical protein
LFFRFPKDSEGLKSWLKALGRDKWIPRKNSVVCSAHFHRSDYIDEKKQRRLKSIAVPSLHLRRIPLCHSLKDKTFVKLYNNVYYYVTAIFPQPSLICANFFMISYDVGSMREREFNPYLLRHFPTLHF